MTANQWGVKGSNGGDAVVLLTNQNIEGDFLVDGDSKLYINLVKSNIKGKLTLLILVKRLVLLLIDILL